MALELAAGIGAAAASAAWAVAGLSAIYSCAAGLVLGALVLLIAGKTRSAATVADAAEVSRSSWDYIIVGGGTAGCLLANRLSKDGKKRVLVLEAGSGDYDNSMVRIPAGVLRLFRSKYDWNFMTSNETATSGRGIYLCRGKVLGGSSSLNVLLYTRGDANDYDLWDTKFGCTGWKGCDVLPHFTRTEDDKTGAAVKDKKHHGVNGEWAVDHVRYQNPLSKAFLESCQQAGYKMNDDFNNWDRSQEGFGRFPVSQRNGSRCSAASSLLEPALKDSARHLKVLAGAMVQKVVFDGTKTVGVQFTAEGFPHVARLAPEGEVLLTGGAIHSPQLLMLSGVGPKSHLSEHGISVVADVPAVGENLQDHPAAVVSYECPESKKGVSVTSKLRIGGTSIPHPWPMLEWMMGKSGVLTSTGCDHGGFLRTSAAPTDSLSPDLQMRFLAARAVTADGMGTFATFKKTTAHPDGFSFQAIAARPESRGRVLLASADPNDKPVIEGNYLTNKGDVATIREGLRLGRKLAQQPAFKDYIGDEVFPGPDVKSDAELDKYIADSVHTANALVGTCRMGAASDPQAAVDPHMRVKGVQGLRVCDASVMPKLPGGQTGSSTVMIAERASDLILKGFL